MFMGPDVVIDKQYGLSAGAASEDSYGGTQPLPQQRVGGTIQYAELGHACLCGYVP
jgi:hypothetical protein